MTEKYTFNGYSLKTWAIKNKDNLKLLFSAGMGIAIASITNVQVGVIATLVSKLGVDAIDYFLKE